jgi:hypothetical protein
VIPLIAATACHQRNDVGRYRRYRGIVREVYSRFSHTMHLYDPVRGHRSSHAVTGWEGESTT